MATESTDPTLGVSPSQGPWTPGGDPWSQLNNRTGNSMSGADGDQPFFHFDYIVSLVKLLVCLCGATGNGAVVWLLGFRLKRTPFSVYILNLACADGIFLLSFGVLSTLTLLHHGTLEIVAVLLGIWAMSSLAGLGLLTAVSTERCVSVLWPLWYRCRRPAHLSCAVCALVWGLGLCAAIFNLVCIFSMARPCHSPDLLYRWMVVVTFLVLCVSSLTLLVRVQCGSRGTRPSRLYVSILVTVLAFLLLGLPYSVSISVLGSKHIKVLSPILELLFTLNSAVNPVIYFFVGRYRQWQGRTPLREVLQRALQDEEEGAEQGVPLSRQIPQNPPEPRGGDLLGASQV